MKDIVDVTVLVEWFQIKVGKNERQLLDMVVEIDHVLNYIGTCEHNIYNIIIILYVYIYVCVNVCVIHTIVQRFIIHHINMAEVMIINVIKIKYKHILIV